MDTTTKRRRRTNQEILADLVAERKAQPKKRTRRTKAQIARDKELETQTKQAPKASSTETHKVVKFLEDDFNAFGNLWNAGEEVAVTEDSAYFKLAFDINGDFILDKSPEEQKQTWGRVRYEVREEPTV
jgi:hypothetical protein